MIYTVPHYYKQFTCVADKCPDTCCAGWQIVIDNQTMKKYKKAEGALGIRLRHSIRWKEGCFKQCGKKCAFLNEQGLCDIYSEAGPDMLCRTCRNYPRHIEEFEGVREISLSLSCPEAARIILSCEEPVRFLTKEKEGEEQYESFDYLLYDKLLDARESMMQILKNREIDIKLRLAMVLALSHDMQRRLEQNQLFQMDELFERYKNPMAAEGIGRKIESIPSSMERMKSMFFAFSRLEVLKPGWEETIKETVDILYRRDSACYFAKKQEFEKAMQEEYGPVSFEIQCEQIAVYFIFTYFCGAVYDGDAYTKVKFAVMSTIWIREMVQAFWEREGRVPKLEETARIVWRYSKEIEHSDLNLRTMENILKGEKVYSAKGIVSVL